MAEFKKGIQIGPYIVLEVLPAGKGGMARVLRAKSSHTQSEVALKISRSDYSDPRFNNALKQEVDILKPLYHPGIVRLIPLPLSGAKQDPFIARALELHSKPWFYAMEYLPGGSLSNLVRNIGIPPFYISCAISTRLVDSLAFLHSRGIVHLDLKPENVLFRFKPEKGAPIEPVLIDFGIAARTKTPRTGGGSIRTMAPEQLRQVRGEIPPEMSPNLEKMDIYSLGVVTYRMFTGTYPFGGFTSERITSAILHKAVQPPREIYPDLPLQVDQLMLRWLAKDPQTRPSLAELKRYLDFWAEGAEHFPEMQKNRISKKRRSLWKK